MCVYFYLTNMTPKNNSSDMFLLARVAPSARDGEDFLFLDYETEA